MKKFQVRLSILFLGGLIIPGLFSVAQQGIQPPFVQEEWSRDYPPFRIAGNLYYVGTYDLASYLITTPEGNVLINTGLATSVPMIRAHMEKLGLRFNDIKIILATHAHFDHVAGIAEIKKITGAKLMIEEKDAGLMADGGNSDYNMGGKGSSFPPVKVDRLLHDHDTISLGGMHIVLLHHPGHTPGASSFLFEVKDEHRSFKVLIANMPTILPQTKLSGMPGYPTVGSDYAYTLNSLKAVHFDIWLASHASQFSLHEKHQPGDPYQPEKFIDQKGFDAEIADLESQYQKRLREP